MLDCIGLCTQDRHDHNIGKAQGPPGDTRQLCPVVLQHAGREPDDKGPELYRPHACDIAGVNKVFEGA